MEKRTTKRTAEAVLLISSKELFDKGECPAFIPKNERTALAESAENRTILCAFLWSVRFLCVKKMERTCARSVRNHYSNI